MFKGDRLISRDFSDHFTYWEEERKNNGNKSSTDAALLEEAKKFTEFTASTRYIGKDKDNNTYWCSYGRILVCDGNGNVLDIFTPTEWKSKTQPTIHPNGDIYFLDYDTEGVYLYKITRCW